MYRKLQIYEIRKCILKYTINRKQVKRNAALNQQEIIVSMTDF